MLFHEGAGGEVEDSGWLDLFEAALSDADFHDGQREFADFKIATKEELFYMRTLAARMDVKRIPHLRGPAPIGYAARRLTRSARLPAELRPKTISNSRDAFRLCRGDRRRCRD